MANQVWKSKDNQIISQYAEKLDPVEAEAETEETEAEAKAIPPSRPKGSAAPSVDGIDFRYMNAPPPKDLLNYKNMEMEMSLWAKTQAGWLSVGVLLILATICFIMTWILWGMHGY